MKYFRGRCDCYNEVLVHFFCVKDADATNIA